MTTFCEISVFRTTQKMTKLTKSGLLTTILTRVLVRTIVFYSFFNSPSLVLKLHERDFYGISTAQKDRKGMPVILVYRKMKRCNFEYLHFDKVACCKWLDRRSITMLFSNGEGMATTYTVPHRRKGSTVKIQVPCRDVIKMYNKGF